jgi:hypothetical protein
MNRTVIAKRVAAVTSALIIGFALAEEAWSGSQVQQPQTTEQVFKNIQVLKGLPATSLQGVMSLFTASLGVACDHCHVDPFDKDEKENKRIAREMIRMTMEINKSQGENAVTCYTCHRGQARTVNVPSMSQALTWAGRGPGKTEALPAVDDVLAKYEQGLGGRAALEKLTTRVVKASRTNVDGSVVEVEVLQKRPNKLYTATVYPSVTFFAGYDGQSGWRRSTQGGDGVMDDKFLFILKRDAEFYQAIDLKQTHKDLKVLGKETVNDREGYVVQGLSPEGIVEKLYFDVQTGLLLRRYRETTTALGPLPFQIDFSDYKEIDGVKLPATIRWAEPGIFWTRKAVDIKHNVPVDNAKFEKSPAK